MLTQNSIESLREHITESVAKMNQEYLFKVYKFISQLYGEELSQIVTKEWESGRIDKDSIKNVILEHRKTHPYFKD